LDDSFHHLGGDWIPSSVTEDVPKPEDDSGLGVWAKMTDPQHFLFFESRASVDPTLFTGMIFHVPPKLSKTGAAEQPLQ